VPKRGRPRQTTRRILVPQETDAAGVAGRFLKGIWKIATWLFGTLFGWALVIATLFGLIVLMPNVAVFPPSEGVDPMKPFHVSFVVTNQASLPIYSVVAACGEADIGANMIPPYKASPEHPLTWGGLFKKSSFSAEKLAAQESHTFQCEEFWDFHFNGRPIPATSCSITINLTMRILHIIPWSTHSDFVGELGDDKLIHWQFKPMQEVKG
jgi:hypothetical protein